ncbi:MAG: hypothetical protein HBSIN02_21600 [Bacteroidia bacterium]|nr:MAG: hypothetical protein HBSIN02_21600 [Bacteroidia bacterium]
MIAGGIIAFVSAVPGLNLLNCCCCAGILLGGVLAVYLHKQEFEPGMPAMESSDALIVGLTSGLVSAFGATLLNLLMIAFFGDVAAELARSLIESLIEQADLPPETVEQLRQQIEESIAESTTFLGVMQELLFNLLIHPLFAMLGGLIGHAVLKRRDAQQTLPPAGV